MRKMKMHRPVAIVLVIMLLLQLMPSVLAAECTTIADIENPCAASYTVSAYPDEAVLQSEFPDTISVTLTSGETADIPVEWYCEDAYGDETQPFYIFWAVWDESAYPLSEDFNYQKAPYIEVDLDAAAQTESEESGSASSYTTDAVNPVLSTGIQNILKRAYQQVNIAWTPLERVDGYTNGAGELTAVYDAGVTYYGIPYGMQVTGGVYVPHNASFDTFLNAVKTPGSLFYSARGSYYGRNSTYYATDCSAFASYSYGITRMTTYGFASSGYFTTISDLNTAKPGDCLNNASSHIIMVTNIIRDSSGKIVYYELSEETPPKARTILRTAAYVQDLVANHSYVLKRYTNADSVTSPNGYDGYVETVPLNGSTVSLSYSSVDYNGTAMEPAVTVTLGSNTLREGVDYTVSYQDNIRPGQALVKVSGIGAYGGTSYALFTITNPCPFADVSIDEYYYEPVLWASRNEIAAGITASQFGPDWSCTRAQMVTFLYRVAGEPQPEMTEMPFTDVDEDAYYYNAVLWAYENRITLGMTETTFGPDLHVTRGQVVCFLYRLANGGEPEEPEADPEETDVEPEEPEVTPGETEVEPGETEVEPGETEVEPGETEVTPGETEVEPGETEVAPEETEAVLAEADAGLTIPFTDVSEDAYYYNAVCWAYANSITAGITETQFCPSWDCTRAQIITLLYRYEGNS